MNRSVPAIAAVAIVNCLTLAGCGSGDSASPHTRMVSDVGVFVRDQVAIDGSYSIYRYREVLVHGDMPLYEFARLMEFASDRLHGGEVVIYMYNYEAMPPSAQLPSRGEEDVSIWSCTDGGGDSCRAGNFWSVAVNDGELLLVGQGLWRMDKDV